MSMGLIGTDHGSWVENLGFGLYHLDPWPKEPKTAPIDLLDQPFCNIFAHDLGGSWSRSWVEKFCFGLCHLDMWSNELKPVPVPLQAQLIFGAFFVHDLDGSWSRSWVKLLVWAWPIVKWIQDSRYWSAGPTFLRHMHGQINPRRSLLVSRTNFVFVVIFTHSSWVKNLNFGLCYLDTCSFCKKNVKYG